MKNFFEGIAWLFEEILFLPYNVLRNLELSNWTLANIVNWAFLLIGFAALIYWVLQLNLFEQKRRRRQRSVCALFFINQTRYLFGN